MSTPQTATKRRRIGIDGRTLQESKPSGVSQYTQHVIRNMIQQDPDSEYIIFYNSFRNIRHTLPTFEGNVETRIYRFPNKILEILWRVFPYPKIDRLLKVDTFFSPHFVTIPLSQNVQKVVTIHDLSFMRNRRYFPWRKNLWHWHMNPCRTCHKADKIIAVSHATAQDIISLYGIEPKKIQVIHNGAPVYDRDTSNRVSSIEKWGLMHKGYILFIATLEPRKNVEGIVDAFYHIQDKVPHTLVIAGKSGWLFANIFKKVKKYGLEKRVVFTGFVEEKEKEALFSGAALFVFPSFYEGFGIPPLEASRYRIPIITSTTSSLPEIIGDAAILINPHNTNDLASAMQEVLTDTSLSINLARKTSRLDSLSWQRTAYETLAYLLS